MRIVYAVVIVAILAVGGWWFVAGRQTAPEPAEPPIQAVAGPEMSEEGVDEPSPSFDIVRIDSNGVTVAAGRADPGAQVALKLNGLTVANVQADSRGEWSIVMTDPLPAGSGELTLEMTMPDGDVVISPQTVVVSIPESGDPLIVLGQPGRASQVLQGPVGGIGAGPLMLMSVDYGETGAVIFAGRATPGATVRVLADGDVVGETTASAQGEWTIEADATLPPGRYDLQVDQVEDGRVTAVVTLPFERVEPGALAGGRVVVQPGNSLWQIARRAYGEGLRYTVIYEANAAEIQDPELIYPGQVFAVPED